MPSIKSHSVLLTCNAKEVVVDGQADSLGIADVVGGGGRQARLPVLTTPLKYMYTCYTG